MRAPHPPSHSELEAAADRTALAAILESQGRTEEARTTLQHVLPVLERVLGPDHYEVGVTLERLGGIAAASGAHVEAGELYGRALAIYERTLGISNRRTVACRANRDEELRL